MEYKYFSDPLATLTVVSPNCFLWQKGKPPPPFWFVRGYWISFWMYAWKSFHTIQQFQKTQSENCYCITNVSDFEI
jgi:hypothetical protein